LVISECCKQLHFIKYQKCFWMILVLWGEHQENT
jgi:hypothetical protein